MNYLNTDGYFCKRQTATASPAEPGELPIGLALKCGYPTPFALSVGRTTEVEGSASEAPSHVARWRELRSGGTVFVQPQLNFDANQFRLGESACSRFMNLRNVRTRLNDTLAFLHAWLRDPHSIGAVTPPPLRWRIQ